MYSHVTNRMACALVNNFTRNLLLYNYIFSFIAYNYCNATLRCSDLLRCSLSLALYNIVLLVSSASPHIKVILPPFHLLRSRYLYPFRTWRLLIYKNKIFSIIMLSSKVISVSHSNCRLYLLYLTLTLLGYVFLV